MRYNIFICYAEHTDLLDYIKSTLSCAISPLHTDDEEDGNKPHYHILCTGLDNNKRAMLRRLKATEVFSVDRPDIYYRYLWHDPSLGETTQGKTVYDENDIVICNHFVIPRTIGTTDSLKAIFEIIQNNSITTLSALITCVYDDDVLIRYISTHSTLINTLIRENTVKFEHTLIRESGFQKVGDDDETEQIFR